MSQKEQNLNNAQNPKLDISDVSDNFNDIGEMCERCSGDGWIYHSKGGQSGLMKDCPKCGGKGVAKKSH